MHVTGRWPIALPAYESADGLGAGAPAAVADPPPSDDAGSLSDHEASFSPTARSVEPADEATTDTRDDKGQFKPRHRAASQRADVDDVPTINAHTKRIKDAEARLGADIVKQDGESERAFTLRRRAELLERQATAPSPVARREEPAARPATTREPEPAKPAASADAKDPKPTESDFDDYGDFVDARARWNYREARREEQAANAQQEAERAEQSRQEQAVTQFNAWIDRREAFFAKHPARTQAITAFLESVQSGTPIGDALIDSDVGAELADYLASNPAERTRIEGLSPLSAIRALGRLEETLVASQRPSPSTRSAAAPTGSAPASSRPPLAKPPNPVRTGSIAEPDTPPDSDEQSLSSHEKFYKPKR